MRLKDRVAVVTGGAQGIGAAISKKLAAEGALVQCCDMNLEGAEQTAREIVAAGGSCWAHKLDVTSREQVEAVVGAVAERFGGVRILVNNAGITRDQLLFKMTDEEWDAVMNVHVKGAFLCTRAAQKYMVQAKAGEIVCISSTSALGNRGQVNYASAKAALQGFVRTLAIELGPFGIRANAVGPGFIQTAMTKATAERLGVPWEQFVEERAKQIPLRRAGVPADIANVVCFLVSDESSYVSGQVIYVRGGPGGT